jgi:hypothetical protein
MLAAPLQNQQVDAPSKSHTQSAWGNSSSNYAMKLANPNQPFSLDGAANLKKQRMRHYQPASI